MNKSNQTIIEIGSKKFLVERAGDKLRIVQCWSANKIKVAYDPADVVIVTSQDARIKKWDFMNRFTREGLSRIIVAVFFTAKAKAN